MPAIRTFIAITSVAGAFAVASPALASADTPVDPGTPMAQDEGAPLPGGDPLPEDPNWVDSTVGRYDGDEGAPLPGGDPEPKDPNWVDTTPARSDDEGAPLPGGDPEAKDPNWVDTTPAQDDDKGAPLPGGDPDPVWIMAASVLAGSR